MVVDSGIRRIYSCGVCQTNEHGLLWDTEISGTELTFGNYDDAPEKGQWAVWTGYRKFGQGVSFSGTTEDDILLGYKGWFIGGAWAPFKNIGLIARYGSNKEITNPEGKRKLNHIFGRVEFFF